MVSPANASVGSVVIVGNGIAGLAAAAEARRLHPRCVIHLVGASARRRYDVTALASVVVGHREVVGQGLLPEKWFAEFGITERLGTTAVSLDVRARQVTLDTGEPLGYDRLILATGAAPAQPPINGLPLDGVHLVHAIEDLAGIRGDSLPARAVVVVGGAVLGVRTAAELALAGARVTLVERKSCLLPELGDRLVSQFLSRRLAGLGVCVLTGRLVRHAYGGKRVVAVGLEETQPLSCDLLLLCAERRPNVELARAAGLPVRRGIVVDDTMRTSHPHVFAVGMAAQCVDRVATAWPDCVEQARIAAEHAVTRRPSRTRHYRAGSALTELDLPGLHVAAVGRTRPGAGDHVLVVEQPHRRLYRKIVLTGSGTVAGGISVNEPGAAAALLESAVADRSNVRRHLAELRSGDLAALRAAIESSRRARRRTRGNAAVGYQETERFMVDVERIWRIKTASNGDLEVRLAPTHSGDRQVRLEQVGADESGLQALDLVAARALAETLLEACEVATALRPSGGSASL